MVIYLHGKAGASLIKFLHVEMNVESQLFSNKLERFLYSSSAVDCVFNILCNYHRQTIGGILPVIFGLDHLR